MKKIFKRVIAPALILLLPLISLAQNRPLSGVVLNEKGEPITDVSITIKGSRLGTTTNNKGEFSISVPATARTFIVSSLNYSTKEYPVTEEFQQIRLAGLVSKLE